MKNAAKMLVNKLPKLKQAFAALSSQDVLVGVPSDTTARTAEPGQAPDGMNNATIAYIQNNGSPAMNVPPRPFMEPGIEAVKPAIIKQFEAGARNALDADDAAVERALMKAGMLGATSMQNMINQGIAPALAASTVANRWRQRKTKSMRKGEMAYLDKVNEGLANGDSQSAAEEAAAAATGIKPLLNTAQLRNALTYVIRKK